MAALSDYIRVSLLYEYGGLWIDSTVFCSQKLPAKIFESKLFTVKSQPSGTKYVAAGKWNVQILGTNEKHSRVFFLIKDIFEQYWKKYSVLTDYLLVDYSFEYIYENDRECRADFDAVPYSNGKMHELLTMMNEPYDSSYFDERGKEGTYLFKLTYKMPFVEGNKGKKTFYSYILNSSE